MVLDKYTYKIIVFGDSNTGKSTFLHRLISNEFNTKISKTIGVEFNSKVMYVDNVGITLQIWDFSGEERFHFLLEMYCRGVKGGIFFFDMSDFNSLGHATEWIHRVRRYTRDDFPILIVGTKEDLIRDKYPHTDKNKGKNDLFVCSAKTGENVNLIFQSLTEKIYRTQMKIPI